MLAISLVISVIITLAVVRFVHLDLVNRLVVIVDNVHRVSTKQQLQDRVKGKDELSELDFFIHQMSESMHKSEQMRQEFSAMLTHDMRAPVSQVYFLLGMLAEGVYDDDAVKRKSMVRKSFSEIARLTRLIENLLTADKLDSQQIELSFEKVSSEHLLLEVRDALDNESTARGVSINVSNAHVQTVTLDVFQMKRVLINLCSNALKHSAKGSVVEVNCRRNEDRVIFEVVDEGPGIPDELKEKLFERYQQADDVTARQGFGLGLYICKVIVEAHGGTIFIQDRHDGKTGAIFYVSLPVGSGHNAAVATS